MFARHYLIGGLAAVATAALGGCVTAKTIETPEARAYAEAVARNCVVTSHRNNQAASKEETLDASNVSVRAIDYGEEGWVKVDVSNYGLRGNVYINPQLNDMYCSGRSFSAAGFRFVPLPAGRVSNSAANRPPLKDERSVAVSWDGFEDLAVGKIGFTERQGVGTMTVTMPDGSASCMGSYQLVRDPATWELTCTNGLTAEGSLTLTGDGAIGEGADSKGRSIRFTMGAG